MKLIDVHNKVIMKLISEKKTKSVSLNIGHKY